MAQTRSTNDTKIPEALAVALNGNKNAAAAFESLSPSHQREYVKWINEAKREETRKSRAMKAVAKLSGESG